VFLFKYTKRRRGARGEEGEDGSSKEDALSCFLSAFWTRMGAENLNCSCLKHQASLHAMNV
jgi:hypothetical protein